MQNKSEQSNSVEMQISFSSSPSGSKDAKNLLEAAKTPDYKKRQINKW